MAARKKYLSDSDDARLKKRRADLTDEQFADFAAAVERYRLDPFSGQIYGILRRDKKSGKPILAVQTGIDGYRLIADRTGAYAGSDEPVFTESNYQGRPGRPHRCSVTVHKIVEGSARSFSNSAWWDEYYPGDGPGGQFWRNKPHVMLAKCAEAGALRKAFPGDLSGLYVAEELDQWELASSQGGTPDPTKGQASTPEKNQPEAPAATDFVAVFKGQLDGVVQWPSFDQVAKAALGAKKKGSLSAEGLAQIVAYAGECRGKFLISGIDSAKSLGDLSEWERLINYPRVTKQNLETLQRHVAAKRATFEGRPPEGDGNYVPVAEEGEPQL